LDIPPSTCVACVYFCGLRLCKEKLRVMLANEKATIQGSFGYSSFNVCCLCLFLRFAFVSRSVVIKESPDKLQKSVGTINDSCVEASWVICIEFRSSSAVLWGGYYREVIFSSRWCWNVWRSNSKWFPLLWTSRKLSTLGVGYQNDQIPKNKDRIL